MAYCFLALCINHVSDFEKDVILETPLFPTRPQYDFLCAWHLMLDADVTYEMTVNFTRDVCGQLPFDVSSPISAFDSDCSHYAHTDLSRITTELWGMPVFLLMIK